MADGTGGGWVKMYRSLARHELLLAAPVTIGQGGTSDGLDDGGDDERDDERDHGLDDGRDDGRAFEGDTSKKLRSKEVRQEGGERARERASENGHHQGREVRL